MLPTHPLLELDPSRICRSGIGTYASAPPTTEAPTHMISPSYLRSKILIGETREAFNNCLAGAVNSNPNEGLEYELHNIRFALFVGSEIGILVARRRLYGLERRQEPKASTSSGSTTQVLRPPPSHLRSNDDCVLNEPPHHPHLLAFCRPYHTNCLRQTAASACSKENKTQEDIWPFLATTYLHHNTIRPYFIYTRVDQGFP
ncbi:hypothetical protein B0T26DRAFT_212485 [Lasiosphaeria miniovina]|uniref:Uncharacterized protein n=1 Tax=Lasiosphaeria miniovina TaxID=1954250 RepID=A0AA40AUP8_9PEZI|nr:uncharacterized protein B0T26DRAFT_212485 [Lasiosphaeria miniovina]KAK0722307.1 hypothetical protein B0T26DRAFT_212485 [Lasiosphaeria miniovina]